MKLFYRKYGEGPPLVILHGLYGSSDNWVSVAKSLGDSFTVYLPDLRNHGSSPWSDIHDYNAMSDDLHEFAGDLSLKKFFLAGHSMGGKTAVSFVLKWPELINGLLVADISPFLDETFDHADYIRHLTILNSILSVDPATVASRVAAESLLSGKIDSERVIQLILKNLQRGEGNNFSWRLNAASLLKNLGNIMKAIDQADYAIKEASGFPVLFLKGEFSNYLPSDHFCRILNLFPSAEFKNIPHAGHWIQSDNPDEVIKNFRLLKHKSGL